MVSLLRSNADLIEWELTGFAQSQHRRGIRKAVRWRQILPRQIVRHLDGFNN